MDGGSLWRFRSGLLAGCGTAKEATYAVMNISRYSLHDEFRLFDKPIVGFRAMGSADLLECGCNFPYFGPLSWVVQYHT
jgi:hypothetical protein